MNTIEERFAREVAVVMGEIVVTETQLRDARRELDDRVAVDRRSRNRRTALAVAAAAVAGVVGIVVLNPFGGADRDTAPVTPPQEGPALSEFDAAFLTGEPATAELLTGVWRFDDAGVVVRFGADGTLQFDGLGTLYSNPSTTGTYTVEDDGVVIMATTDAQQCAAETELRASLPEQGILRMVRTATLSGTCPAIGAGQKSFEQILPTGPQLQALDMSNGAPWEPVRTADTLHGFWLAHGGGHVLQMDATGAYFVADDSGDPVDQGQWDLRRGDLVLTSSSNSTACQDGDRMVWRGVEAALTGTWHLRGALADNACGGAWTSELWILMPDTAP